MFVSTIAVCTRLPRRMSQPADHSTQAARTLRQGACWASHTLVDGRPLSFSGLGLRRHHKLPGTLPQRTEVQSGVSRALVEVTHQGWLEGGHLLRVPEAGFLERWCLLWG